MCSSQCWSSAKTITGKMERPITPGEGVVFFALQIGPPFLGGKTRRLKSPPFYFSVVYIAVGTWACTSGGFYR